MVRGNVEHDLVAVGRRVIAGFAVEVRLGDDGQGIGTAGMERLAAGCFRVYPGGHVVRGNVLRRVAATIHRELQGFHNKGALLGW